MTSNSDLTFLTNVWGIQSSKKRIRLIESFKSKLNHNGVLFLQERHSSIKNENEWANDFNCPAFFSRNSCAVLIGYLVFKKSFVLNEQKTDIKLEEF